MTAFTVTAVTGPKEWASKYGPMHTWALDVTGPDGPQRVEMNQKPTSPAPTIGQVIDGTLEPGQGGYPAKLKKTPPPQGAAGAKNDPEVQAKIVRQHSQDMALKYLRLATEHAGKPVPTLADLKAAIDWFHADAMEAKP